MNAWAWMWPALLYALPGRTAVFDCLSDQPTEVVVRIGESASPQRLQFIGAASPPLRLQHPDSGAVLWSAAASTPAMQVFPALWAGFSGSLAALDLDGDGLHDRLYAGDLAGRVWRFDIHNGSPPEGLLTGGIFASLGGVPAMRAFVAAPDLSLSRTAAGEPMLNIAVGSASLAPGVVPNRFYVLRDREPFESRSQAEYDRRIPLQESDLAWVNDPAGSVDDEALAANRAGFYVTLAGSGVVLRSITVSGRAVLAIAQQPASAGNCSVAVTISSISLDTGKAAIDFDGDGAISRDERLTLPERVPATTDFMLSAAPQGSEARCSFGGTDVAGCSLSTSLISTWWRREDAD